MRETDRGRVQWTPASSGHRGAGTEQSQTQPLAPGSEDRATPGQASGLTQAL